MATLKRDLSLFDATVAGVGIILGAGIYALIGNAAAYAGPATWLSFLIASVIAALTGLSYAELSTIFKTDAGEYEYLKTSFGKTVAFLVSVLIIFTGIFSTSTVALAFGGYLNKFFPLPILLLGLVSIVLFSYINHHSIKGSSRLNALFTAIEMFGLLFIIMLGLNKLGTVSFWEMPHGLTGVLQGAGLVFFAYMGFETIVKLTEEAKDPVRTIPWAIIISIIVSTIIYILVSLSSVSILDWESLANSTAPLADVAAQSLGAPAFLLIGIIALFSTGNTILMTLVTTSRLVYGMAKMKALPKMLAYVHPKRRTPTFAVIGLALFTLLVTFIGDLSVVANITSIFLFVTFALVNLSLIILRYKNHEQGIFRAPCNIGNFPVLSFLGLVSSVVMIYFVLLNLSVV